MSPRLWLTLVVVCLVALSSGCTQPDRTPQDGKAASSSPSPSETVPDGPASEPSASEAVTVSSSPGDDARAVVAVSVYGADVDAPGALVPMVVTAAGVGVADQVTFTIALGASAGTCEGQQWRHSGGLSQQCWVTMPPQAGAAEVTASAQVSGAGRSRTAAGGRYSVRASGPVAQAPDQALRTTITECGNTTDEVWLTFDDGFLSVATMRAILDTLRSENVKGRFFAVGTWARAHPEMVAEIRSQGHLVENHTRDHAWLNTLGDAELRSQIAGGPDTDTPRLVRPGYGAAAFTDRVVAAANGLGYQVCYWTVDPRDWDKPSAELIIARVVNGDAKTPPVRAGGVVLMHMTGLHTADALPGLIAAIRAKGLALDRLHE